MDVVQVILASGVVGVVLTYGQTILQRRRDRYAQVVETLVSWIEYPFRIRRRTSDEPGTLTELADLGHELQERKARDQAWVSADSARVGRSLDSVRAKLDPWFAEAAKEAWLSPPVEGPRGMVAGLLGPECSKELGELQRAIQKRCRWYRAIA